MVNSNIIRGGGLVVLAGTYVLYERTLANNVLDNAKQLYIELIGAGRGSMYNTCSEESETLQKLTSVNLAEKPATDLKYNFYSINNPKDYLSGDDAIIVEQGPYKLRRHSIAYDVSQVPSALTKASTPERNGALEYSVANAYLVLDQDVTATSNLVRNDDLSLSFSGSKVALPATKRSLGSHLSMKDSIVNFSPDYLSLLGAMNDEVNMVLSFQCTSDQIANIGVAGKDQCTDGQFGDLSASNCACCMMDDAYTLAASRNTGSPPEFINCNSFFDDEGFILSKLSLLASYDGGVAVKSAGEKKYDGSGADFTSTLFGQTEIHTALIQEHTINDLMFGYPSAYLGQVAFYAQMEHAKKSLSSPLSSIELSKLMLTGQMDNDLPFKLGNIAEYTSKVGSVCLSACVAGGECSGHAPERHETSDIDKIKLGGIDCKPYTSAFKTIEKCAAIDAALQLDPNADGYEMCVCANGNGGWASQGCCLAGGMHDGTDLTGEGCLYEVAGAIDPNYAGKDASVSGAVDLGTALQTWIARESPEASTEFLCPASGTELDEHAKFGYYETYAGSNKHVTFYHTGNDRIRQDDVANSESTVYSAPVTGVSGKYFQPKGLSQKVGTNQISDGFPKLIPHPVYVPGAKKPIDFVFEGVRDKFVRNKICGTDTCLVSARLRPNVTTFQAVEGGLDGAGLPYNGLQPVGHVNGPSATGRPEYLHQPLYLGGDEELYTQQDCSYVERVDGNGIKIYRPASDADPGVFSVATSGSNYQVVDKTYVDSQVDTLQSHIDIEVATGLGARQRMRFGTSYSIWECNPLTNGKCKLPVNSKGLNACYASTGSTVFNDMGTTDKNDLTTLGRSNFTYPCSAANLLTPNVVGGKVIPMYWYEESTIHATTAEIDTLAAIAESYSKEGITFIIVLGVSSLTALIGVAMVFLCLWFEQKHSFMQSEETVPLKADS